tara:strand:- start:440 stop:784 length:345 start_codon:yes stop_codon:yes gene_type:complete
MEQQAITDLLINGSPMACFAAFLLWNFYANRKQISELSEKQFLLYRELDQKKDEAEEKIRTRYNKVIQDLQSRDAQLRSSLEQRLDRHEMKMDLISERLQKIELKDIARNPGAA